MQLTSGSACEDVFPPRLSALKIRATATQLYADRNELS